MLEGYRPIDFSGMFPQRDLSEIARNRVGLSQAAMNILANSKWSGTPVTALPGLKKSLQKNLHEQTLWGRAVDLLSIPVYSVANAVDDAIAGHQASDSDSVLSDLGQIIGGAFTGNVRGTVAGLRGGLAPSQIAADPTDKIYLGDSLIRLDTGMSARDALDPKNREAVRTALMNKKINKFLGDDDDTNKYFYDFDSGKVEVTDEDLDQYFKDMEIYGFISSALADPLNFVSGPTKAFQGTKGFAEIPDEAAQVLNVTKDIKGPGNATNTLIAAGKVPSGSHKVNLTGNIQNYIATPGGLVKPPEWFNFPRSAADMKAINSKPGEIPTNPAGAGASSSDVLFENLIGSYRGAKDFRTAITPKAPKIPDAQIALANDLATGETRIKMVQQLMKAAVNNTLDPMMQRMFINTPMPQLQRLTNQLKSLPDLGRRLANPAERKKIASAFDRVLRADADNLRIAPTVKPAAQILNETDEIGSIALVQNAKPPVAKSSNPTRDAKIVNDLISQFEPQLSLKAIPSGIRDAAQYRAAMKKHGAFTGPKQVNIWNALTSKHLVNAKTPARFEKALDLLRQVEDEFMAKGHIPMSSTPKLGDSIKLRLSQVLRVIGPSAAAINPNLLTKILRGEEKAIRSLGPDVVQQIEALKAGEALTEAPAVVTGVNAAKQSLEDLIKGPLSAARIAQYETIGSKVAADITRATGGSEAAAKTAQRMFVPKNPIDNAIRSNSLNTRALMSHPNVSSRLDKLYSTTPKINRAIAEALQSPPPKVLGTKVGEEARVLDWLGARFNAAYKNADMRPIYLRNANTARSTVARRAEFLNQLAKQYDINNADMWNDAFRAAQGKIPPVAGSQTAELTREIQSIMENLFTSSGLNKAIALENSVVGRAQLIQSELNANMRRFGMGEYKFKGDGVDWIKSWENWDIKNPLDFLFKIQNVVEHTVREKIMFDDIISRFGVPKPTKGYTTKVSSHPRLAGYYFGPEAASQINTFVRNLKDITKPSSKSLQYFDKILSKWKAGVTIYVPSHHIRNLIGDTYFNWVAGVNSLAPYSTAMKVMKSQKGRYEGFDTLEDLVSPDALKNVLSGKTASTPQGRNIALTMRNGQQVTNDMLYTSAFQEGILPTTRVLEDIPDDAATALDKIKPLGGKGQKAAHTLSESRDHFVRLAHYADVLKKSSKPFEQAVQEAAATVRKWHPDGTDLTAFERNVMRRMFPFYSWTRKALPLIVESLVATPGKSMVYPKAQYLAQQLMGIDTGPMSDPFPTDQLFPDWLREKGIGPVFGEPGSYGIINPGNPLMDMTAQINDPGKMFMGMLNPGARIPLELGTGREAQTGAPIEGLMDPDYIAKQIPGVSHLGRATGEFGVSDTTKEMSQGYNMQNIINLLSALGLQNTGPYQKSAEFDLREYLKGTR